jgi:hypothetical protein
MAAGPTYEPIATTTLSSSSGTVTFSSISSSYTDLVLVTMAKLTSGTSGMRLRFNSDTGSNYSNTFLYGDGTSSGSVGNTSTGCNFYYGAYLDSSNWGITTSNIMNYSNSTTKKTVITRDGSAALGVDAVVSLYFGSTSAITNIDVQTTNSNVFASGSTFTLYGIAAA